MERKMGTGEIVGMAGTRWNWEIRLLNSSLINSSSRRGESVSIAEIFGLFAKQNPNPSHSLICTRMYGWFSAVILWDEEAP
ncbi:hypothetical protein AKJ16_DCAP12098 [Drosera capensis]